MTAVSRDEAHDREAGAIHSSGCHSLWDSIRAVQHWYPSSLCHLSILTQLRTGLVINLNAFGTCHLFPLREIDTTF